MKTMITNLKNKYGIIYAVSVWQQLSVNLLTQREYSSKKQSPDNIIIQQQEKMTNKNNDYHQIYRGSEMVVDKKLFDEHQRTQRNRNRDSILQPDICISQHRNPKIKDALRISEQNKNTSSHWTSDLEKQTSEILKRYNSQAKSKELCDSKTKIKYLLLSRGDPLYKNIKLLVTSRKQRKQQNKLILEGKRLILDGIEAGLSLDIILFNRMNTLDGVQITERTRLIQVADVVLQEWSNLATCAGVIGIFDHPQDIAKVTIRNRTIPPLPITVICDNIREPNNLGSIIRSCAAIPVQNVVLLKGCAHPWDSKCLRGGAGAHFRINILGPMAIGELDEFIPANAYFLAADNTVDRADGTFTFRCYDEVDYYDMEHVVLIIGGETYGISNDLRGFIQDIKNKSKYKDALFYNVHIPMASNIESLNTASAVSVILCEIRRQICKTKIMSNSKTNQLIS